jgi:hypothetical protein
LCYALTLQWKISFFFLSWSLGLSSSKQHTQHRPLKALLKNSKISIFRLALIQEYHSLISSKFTFVRESLVSGCGIFVSPVRDIFSFVKTCLNALLHCCSLHVLHASDSCCSSIIYSHTFNPLSISGLVELLKECKTHRAVRPLVWNLFSP